MTKGIFAAVFGALLFFACDGNKPSAPTPRPIAITSPANNAVVSDTVLISASPGVGYVFDSVLFYIDSDLVYIDTLPPYTHLWDVSVYRDSSYHWLKVSAFGSIDAADSVRVRVTIPGGAIRIIFPAPGAILSDTVRIKARQAAAYSFDSVLFKINDVTAGRDSTAETDSSTGVPLMVFAFLLNVSGYQDNSTLSLKVEAFENGLVYVSGIIPAYVMFDTVRGQFDFISTFALSAPSQRVATEGGHLCAAIGSSGIIGIDITSPSSPHTGFLRNTNGFAYGVDIASSYLAVADGDQGVERLKITAADSLQPAGYFNSAGISRNAKISGDLIFVADQDALQIVRISGDSLIAEARVLISGGLVIDVDAIGSIAFVADYSGITAIDASTPASPVVRSRYTAIDGQGRSVAAIDTFVFLGTTAEILKLSCADLDSLKFVSRLAYTSGITGVFAADSILFASIGGTTGGAAAIRYRNQAAMIQLHQYINNDNCRDICTGGPFVYLAGQTKIDILRFVP